MASTHQALLAVLAHRQGLLSSWQLADALVSAADAPDDSDPSTWLRDHRRLTPEQHAALHQAAEQHLARHQGDSRQALGELLDPPLRRELLEARPTLAACL